MTKQQTHIPVNIEASLKSLQILFIKQSTLFALLVFSSMQDFQDSLNFEGGTVQV